MIRTLLVDDEPLLRKSIKLLIEDVCDIKIVGECGDGGEVVNFVQQNETDVILMDVEMPKVNGIEATKLVLKLFPKIKIIGHSSHFNKEYIDKMYKAGAVEYLLKRQQKGELIIAIYKAYSNNKNIGFSNFN